MMLIIRQGRHPFSKRCSVASMTPQSLVDIMGTQADTEKRGIGLTFRLYSAKKYAIMIRL